ncbi:hypothetical protein M947_11355 [Sulfurimonas hongkongensis]|uniref:Glycosyltransferase RgtA/B/C/D-like domain-containing protein n=2 Tax=Sulfurimonas hongkongensis TaxID=1172190 RepID=T0KLU8_9BACT|nr:hypothetical protein M947_11355 [Sulfurimonas hongkongensis]
MESKRTKITGDIYTMTLKPNSTLFHSNSLGGLLFVISLATLFISYTLPIGFITGNSSYWLSQHDDITQYLAGFNAYFNEDWHFPLFKIDSFNYPIGTRSTFVDIIPIYSLLLKLILPKSLFGINPFGYYIALCFIAQGISAWLILRVLNINSYLALLILSTFFILSASFLARLGHISLMSHFIILLSFALYIRAKKTPYQPFLWTALLTVAFYINIYLFTMSLTIFFATIVTNLKRLQLKQNLTQFFTPLLLIALTSYLTIFPLPSGEFAQDFGWGYYSMNLLAPFYGGAFISIPNAEMPGQYEGFNYLGLGLIFLLIYAIYLQRKHDRGFFTRHRYIFILFILFFIYSLSYKIYFGTFKIASIHYPSLLDSLVHQFRASGRFFWPVGYAVAIFSVVMVLRHTNSKKAAFILLLTLLLQVADLRQRVSLFIQTTNRVSPTHINFQNLKKAIGQEKKHIYFYPKFRCSKLPPHNTILPTMLYASQNSMTINTGYIARYQPDCNDTKKEISASSLKNSIYIFAKDEFTQEQIDNFFDKQLSITCSQIDLLTICKEEKAK